MVFVGWVFAFFDFWEEMIQMDYRGYFLDGLKQPASLGLVLFWVWFGFVLCFLPPQKKGWERTREAGFDKKNTVTNRGS